MIPLYLQQLEAVSRVVVYEAKLANSPIIRVATRLRKLP